MKRFVYEVGSWEKEDTVAFGTVWQEAKSVAIANNLPIYRTVINNDQVERHEVFCVGGLFVTTDRAKIEDIKVF